MLHVSCYSRGPIQKIENVSPLSASLTTIENKQTLVWSVGQKLSPKTLEASLHATVIFAEFPRDEEMKRPTNPQHARRYNLEKFCVEQNAYCEVSSHFSRLVPPSRLSLVAAL